MKRRLVEYRNKYNKSLNEDFWLAEINHTQDFF